MKNILDRLRELIDRPAHFIAFSNVDAQRILDLVAAVEVVASLSLGPPPTGPDNHHDLYSLQNGEVRTLLAALAALREAGEE